MDTNVQILLIVLVGISLALGIAALSSQSDSKKNIEYQLDSIEQRLDLMFKKSKIVEEHLFMMADRVSSLEKASHGLKKDGTPRKKPGRKVVEL